jgi:3-methyladenine DNA glycosylase Tag
LENCRFDQLLFEHHSSGTYWLHVSCKREGNRQIFRPNFNVQKS